MASEQLTNLSKLTSQRTRGALTIESIMQTPDSSSGTNDTARSDESVASSNVVIPADQLGKNQQLPDFSPAPAKSTLDSQLMDIQNQALAIQDKLNQPAPAQDFRTGIQSGLVDLINRDLAGEKGDIRERYDTENKEKLARDLSNEATAIKRDYEAQIRALKENPEGKLRGALQADINQLTEDGNLALSEKMFQYSIANGDFQQAEKLALQAIGDLEKADERRLKLFETAWNFVQNDLSESEKLQIQQTFQADEAEKQAQRQMVLSQFEYQLGAGQRAFDNEMRLRELEADLMSEGGGTGLITAESLMELGVPVEAIPDATRKIAQERGASLPSAGERDTVTSALAVFDNAQVMIDLLQDPDKPVSTGQLVGGIRKGWTIPFTGINLGSRTAGGTSIEEDAFASASTIFTANFIKAISGAQVSDKERKFLERALPDETKQEKTNLVNIMMLSQYIANKAGATLNMDIDALIPQADLSEWEDAEKAVQADLDYLETAGY